jgi:hypothetical protein
MLWIKRNLFLTLGGIVALLLLGAGIYYFWSARAKNQQLEEEIGATTSTLNNLYNSPTFPSQTNIDAAKRETDKLKAVVDQLQKFFVAVPAEKVTNVAFRAYRDNTLAELQRAAEQARTTLPGKSYAFSFETQRTKVEFKEGTFPAVPQQMAEVKALAKILFDAHVDPLVNLRRARVSKDDDESVAVSDYHQLKIETNSIQGAASSTIRSPYEVTFHALSSDLAAVLQGLAASPHGFVVKAVHVEPAPEPGANLGPGQNPRGPQPQPPVRGPQPPANQPVRPPPGAVVGQPAPPVRPPPPAGAPSAVRPVPSDKPIVLLREKRLKVTLLIYAIRTVK